MSIAALSPGLIRTNATVLTAHANDTRGRGGQVDVFAVLAENPSEVAPETVKDIPVDMTVANGKVAFMRDGTDDLDV